MFSGTEDVAGIAMRLDPGTGYANDIRMGAARDPAWNTTTSPSGTFQFYNAPLRYDLTFARGSEVITFRELAFRGVFPSIGEAATPLAFRARTRLIPQPAVKPGNAIAYFAGGEEVTSFRADATRSEGELEIRKFTTSARVFAVEYDAARGIGFASAWGYADLSLSANATVDANIPMGTLEKKPPPLRIDTEAPDGFVVDEVEVVIDFGVERSAQVVAKGPSGMVVAYTPIPFSRPLARARAHRADGAISVSEAKFVDPEKGPLVLKLPDAPTIVEAPEDKDGKAILGGKILASGKGVHEHVLVPKSGRGTSIRVAISEGGTTLPDVTRFGLPVPSGQYVWTVTRWSDFELVEYLGGREVRQIFAHAQSAPRVLSFP